MSISEIGLISIFSGIMFIFMWAFIIWGMGSSPAWMSQEQSDNRDKEVESAALIPLVLGIIAFAVGVILLILSIFI
jgi:hypothetical protein